MPFAREAGRCRCPALRPRATNPPSRLRENNQGVGDVANLEPWQRRRLRSSTTLLKPPIPWPPHSRQDIGPLKNPHPGHGFPLLHACFFGPLLGVSSSFFLRFLFSSELSGVAPYVVGWEKTRSSHAHLFQSSLRHA